MQCLGRERESDSKVVCETNYIMDSTKNLKVRIGERRYSGIS
jgi:hypothetical protein